MFQQRPTFVMLDSRHQVLGDQTHPLVRIPQAPRRLRMGGARAAGPLADSLGVVDSRDDRSQALAIRWLISSSRGRSENTMEERLSGELLDAANNRGVAVKRREDTHRMADANKAFSHSRWKSRRISRGRPALDQGGERPGKS